LAEANQGVWEGSIKGGIRFHVLSIRWKPLPHSFFPFVCTISSFSFPVLCTLSFKICLKRIVLHLLLRQKPCWESDLN
jgi:hypothetical protein